MLVEGKSERGLPPTLSTILYLTYNGVIINTIVDGNSSKSIEMTKNSWNVTSKNNDKEDENLQWSIMWY